jgi:hypothetical protein
MRERGDVVVPKGGDAMSRNHRLRVLMRLLRVFQGLAGMLVSRQVVRLPVLLGYPVGVRGGIV